MSTNYLSPLIDNESINKRNKYSSDIQKLVLTNKFKTPKFSQSENNIKNYLKENSRQKYNKYIRKLNAYKYKNYSFLKDYNILINHKPCNNKNINSFSFVSKSTPFSGQSNNFTKKSDVNKNNFKDNIININIGITSNKNISYENNDFKLFKDNILNSNEKIKINRNKHKMKVNEIINMLLNSTNEENHKRLNSYTNLENNDKFPKEKMIDPTYYIKYDLQKNYFNRSLFKGINKMMNQIGKISKNKEYELNLLKRAIDISNNKIELENSYVPNSENNIYKKKYKDMINQTKYYESFHFNRNDYLKNRKKKYSPYQNILDKTYQLHLNKDFGDKRQNMNEINIKLNKRINLDKNFKECISFDTRVNNILKCSKQTEKNVKFFILFKGNKSYIYLIYNFFLN